MIQIIKFLREFWHATKLVIHKHRKKNKNYIGWQPSPVNNYKLNFDGLVPATDFVIRNFVGQVIVVGSKALGYASVLQAEAQALKYSLL